MTPCTSSRVVLVVACAGMALLAGCASIGGATVARDRFDYNTALADSWKQQTLLNIVKLRYLDLPVFVDVSSIVVGYSLQTGVTIGGVASSASAVQGNYGSVGAQGIYTDRPTISYVPMTGEKFLRGLITPIDPASIFFMLQSGYAADFILGLTVESLNGVRNRSQAGFVAREADPEFIRVLQLLREVQAAGVIGMRVEEGKPRGSTTLLFFRSDDVPADILEKSAELRRLLKLTADQQKFTLAYSPLRGTGNELAVNSRSMLQIMSAFASYVEVPEAHVKERRATPALDHVGAENRYDIVRIRSGRERPQDAYAAVRYHDYWFWIDDSDLQTKRALTAIMFFFTLSEAGSPDRLPLVTIPAQ